nr:tetraspanin-8-like [Ipomoea batatas]
MSNRVFGAMMTATLLFSVPVLLCGIWHSNAAASDKQDKQVMGIMVLILLISFIGFIGWSCSLDKPIVNISNDL